MVRDPIGIRPMFYGYSKASGAIMFVGEEKALLKLCSEVSPFPPGYYYKEGEFVRYYSATVSRSVWDFELDIICDKIHDKLTMGVKKRLSSDVPLGFLLSGGLDSSLVVALLVMS